MIGDVIIGLWEIEGDNPVCPKCQHHNAMIPEWEVYKCRDCSYQVPFDRCIVKSVKWHEWDYASNMPKAEFARLRAAGRI